MKRGFRNLLELAKAALFVMAPKPSSHGSIFFAGSQPWEVYRHRSKTFKGNRRRALKVQRRKAYRKAVR